MIKKTKIQVCKTVETRNAICDWCKEPFKECFTATTKTSRGRFESGQYKVLKEGSKKPSYLFRLVRGCCDLDWGYRQLYHYKGEEEVNLPIDICEDCVKQLAKGVKNEL